jgi:hypothetical protein
MEPDEAARQTSNVIVSLPAGFMLDGPTYERGGELGFDGVDFYVVGRGGALGDVDGSVIAAAFVFFHPPSIVERWDRGRTVMPPIEAAHAFASCLDAWSAAHLADTMDYARLAELEGKLIAAASPAGAPLFAAWAALPEPKEPKALALHRMNVLREWRGAIHGSAVVASGMAPLEAVMVKTPGMAGLLGWPEPYPEPDPHRAEWKAAEAATNRTAGRAFAALPDAERVALVELTLAAQEAATGLTPLR